ncbi:RNA polymerase II transcription factor B 52 kDa subunit [Recurvomyces mirabilis]|uniref:RNA polymerase II transcription factor B subunit 2 n=1 Tax=Recurvomyces mirabilis TaxID=574656 RepID=A0AAE0WWF6_9PEZI|nr:RNA polymerase II transcription factor B 52 kDa subunit [Recurvomyces mirabilis]KAK5158669.1 RNA polymerase II transcription factor B 52 kDa subunit [Recurvomyces mirabilis]
MSMTASQRALDYLEQLPGTTFTKLYQQPSTALAIFRRMLPHLAKTLVMAMLYMPEPFATTSLDTWVKGDAESAQAKDRALSILQRLRILFDAPDAKGRSGIRLSEQFAKSLRAALTGGGGEHRSFGVPCSTADATTVTVEVLDTFARRQWEAILYYVVGSANTGLGGAANISQGTKTLLQKGNYVRGTARATSITQLGFTFLLQEVNAQIWDLLIVYLNYSTELRMDPVDVLSFLFTLGSLELGISYSTSNLTPTQLQMLEDLSDFGVVYQPPEDKTRYYPTRLATTLTSDAPALPNSNLSSTTTTSTTTDTTTSTASNIPSQNEKGYILLETNYRLYAYTTSPLHLSLLSLFCALKTRYPNLTTAKITKKSILRALALSITSDQIITYLTTHAHPLMRLSTPTLPPTVVDQIRLWQLEGERMKSWNGFLIKDIGSQEEYEKAVRMDQMTGYFRGVAVKRKEAIAKREAEMSVKKEVL